jgi:DNA (cytosine-5)-methyltransferase 1
MSEMAAYYNEVDPYCAQWLRNLISEGLIAPGDVDERDIRDVRPDDLRGYVQCHFFAGIGVWSAALRGAGWPDDRPVWTGSCPCQPFSTAGQGGGFADERHLWPAFFHLIDECRPRVVFGEQVASKDGLAWLDLVQADLEGTDYAVGALDFCAAGVGAPHIRQRLWWVADAGRERRDGLTSCVRVADPSGWNPAHRSEAARGGETRELADATGREQRRLRECREGQGRRELPHRGHGATRELADHAVEGRSAQPIGPDRADGGQAPEPRRLRDARELADGDAAGQRELGRGGLLDDERASLWNDPDGRSAASGVADGDRGRPGAGRGDASEVRSLQEAQRQPEQRPALLGRSGGTRELVDTGPTNGLWRDVDWLLCRDGRWRPVEPSTFPLVAGSSPRMGFVCAACIQANEKDPNDEVLSALREIVSSTDRSVASEILQQNMHGCGIYEDPDDQRGGPLPSAAFLQSDRVPELRSERTVPSSSPQRSRSDEQQPGEYSDPLCGLSLEGTREITCDCWSDWLAAAKLGSNRTGRLRGYGNAINKEAAEAFIGAYLTVEHDVDLRLSGGVFA